MEPEVRILTCLLLEKMKLDEVYAKRIGLEDASGIMEKKQHASSDTGEKSHNL